MNLPLQTYIMQKSASHCYSTADRFCKIAPIIFIGDGCGSGFVNRTGFNLSQETSQRRQYWCTASGSKRFWSKPSKEYFSNCLVDISWPRQNCSLFKDDPAMPEMPYWWAKDLLSLSENQLLLIIAMIRLSMSFAKWHCCLLCNKKNWFW